MDTVLLACVLAAAGGTAALICALDTVMRMRRRLLPVREAKGNAAAAAAPGGAAELQEAPTLSVEVKVADSASPPARPSGTDRSTPPIASLAPRERSSRGAKEGPSPRLKRRPTGSISDFGDGAGCEPDAPATAGAADARPAPAYRQKPRPGRAGAATMPPAEPRQLLGREPPPPHSMARGVGGSREAEGAPSGADTGADGPLRV